MSRRRITNTYHFSVEGETEGLYLERLGEIINSQKGRYFNVKFKWSKKRPLAFVRSQAFVYETVITHVVDFESLEEIHQKQFKAIIDELVQVRVENNAIKAYHLGYSNLTFELWIALHKISANRHYNHRSHYLTLINQAFNENFTDLSDFKNQNTLKQLFSTLTLSDVKDAVKRAHVITSFNNKHYTRLNHRNYTYFSENPSLSIHTIIEGILNEANV